MAMAQMVQGVALLPFQDADPAQQQGWWQAIGQGIADFLTVERVRDTVIILIAAGLYYVLARHAKERMILRPTRIAVAQDLRSYARLGVQHPELVPLAEKLESTSKDAPVEEELIMRGLALRRDLAFEARLKQIEALDSDGLRAAAAPVKTALHPPIAAYLEVATLEQEKCTALRSAMASVSRDSAEKFWMDNRKVLRRMRKAQAIGVTGLLLIVLLVVLFGNPALVAFGVLGAVISRTIAFTRKASDDDDKFNWVVLFLVPVVGGLSAYGGVLLIDASKTWGLLGDTFAQVDFGGESANAPTMAAAFLFGFVERLLDNVVDKAAPDGLAAVASQAAAAEQSAATGTTAGNTMVIFEVRGGCPEVGGPEGDADAAGADQDPQPPSPGGGEGPGAQPPADAQPAGPPGIGATGLAGILQQLQQQPGQGRNVVDALVEAVYRFAASGGPQRAPTSGTSTSPLAASSREPGPAEPSAPASGDADSYQAGVRAGTFLWGLLDGFRGPQRS